LTSRSARLGDSGAFGFSLQLYRFIGTVKVADEQPGLIWLERLKKTGFLAKKGAFSAQKEAKMSVCSY
jgi:hypothetical protein